MYLKILAPFSSFLSDNEDLDDLSFEDVEDVVVFDRMDAVSDGVDAVDDFLSNNTENSFFGEVEENHCRLIGAFATHLGCSIVDLDVFS